MAAGCQCAAAAPSRQKRGDPSLHDLRREQREVAAGRGEDGDVQVGRGPDGGVGGAEKEQAGGAGGGSEMRDTGVVAEIQSATREERGEMRQREIAREDHRLAAPGDGGACA